MSRVSILIGVPSSGHTHAQFAQSLAGLIASAQSLQSRRDASEVEISMALVESSVIHANRERIADQMLAQNCTHLLFLDDDMVFDPRVLDILLGRRHPIVACNYTKRGYPIEFTAVRLDGRATVKTTEASTGLEEITWCGFGVCLIEREVFEKTPKPWFLPKYEHGIYSTEDCPFFERTRAQGFKVFIDHDASKMIGHRGLHTFTWQQYQELANGK